MKTDKEQRIFTASKIEVRSEEGKAPKVVGYAAVFNRRSENLGSESYPFFEIIEPGAFRQVLKDDVRAVIDHSGGLQTLARTKSGTLKIEEDEIGLRYEFDSPDTQAGRDIVTIIKRGDIDSSSFAFRIGKGGDEFTDLEDDGVLRTIKPGGVSRLYDVSPVTYPAYLDATVVTRSLEDQINNFRNRDDWKREHRTRHLRILELETQ